MNEGGTRRQLLTLLASGSVVGSAGCLGELSESDETDVDCDPADYSSLATDPPEGSWTPSRGNQQRTGANLAVNPLGLEEVDKLQGTELFADSSLRLPAISESTVYVSDSEDTTHALESETGESKWSLQTEALKPLLVTKDTVYSAARAPELQAIDREVGEFRWLTELDNGKFIETNPIIAGGNVLVGHIQNVQGPDENRYSWYTALDIRCGSTRWSITIENERPRGLATDGQTVYAATDHHLYALDATDGTEHWRVRVTDNYLDQPPVLAGETIILTEQTGHLYALSTEDGSERWNTRDGVTAMHTPTVADGRVFLVEGNPATVYALDVANGERLWEYTDTPQAIPAPVTAVADRLYLLGEFTGNQRDTAIQVLDLATGDRQTEATLPRNADIDTDLSQVDELVVTEHGLFTQSGYTEGTIPERIYRFTPE
jgi:outer membrane protein assembly factor BamB